MSYRVSFNLDQFFKPLEEQVRRVDRLRDRGMQVTAKRLYENIFREWPKDTWYSAANTHVSINFVGDMPLEPPTRPDTPGGAAGRAFKNRQEQLNEIAGSKNIEKVFIGNTVDYSPDVAFEKGLGKKKYAQAVDIVSRTIQAEIDRAFSE